jgi:hypothetical protein
VDRAEFLQGLHPAEAGHRPLASSDWEVAVLDSVVEVAPRLLTIGGADLLQRCAVGAQSVGDDGLRPAVAPHRFLDEFQRRCLVTGLGDVGFQHLALVVDCPLEVKHLAIEFDVDLVEMPSPMGELTHLLHPPAADLAGENRAEPVAPQPHRLVADVDAALEQQVLHVAQRQGVPNVHQDDQPDDLGGGIEPAKRILRRLGFGHPRPVASRG